jgi:hypothetical protein
MLRIQHPRYLLVPSAFVIGLGLGYLLAYLAGLHPTLIPLASAAIGLVVAFSVPLWQIFFVNDPRLSVEISSIRRTVSDDAVVVVGDDPELAALRSQRLASELLYLNPFLGGSRTARRAPAAGEVGRGYTLAELDELLTARKQRFRELPAQIEERKREFERVSSYTPTTLTKYAVDQLNGPLAPEIDFDPDNLQGMIQQFSMAYKERLEELEKTYAELQTSLPSAERRVEILRKDLIDSRSFFTISASLINSGRSNTAVKVPALLRVSIGEGNYIDLKLTLKDFENKSEISANGTRIVIFESPEVSSLPQEDRTLINTYWGQSVRARLYLEDIHSQVYSSNPIAFAEGLYQKIIYDRLAQVASGNEGRGPRP